MNSKEVTDTSFPSLIEKIHQRDMKKILVIMSAGTKLDNTDRLTDAYIKGLVERRHSVSVVVPDARNWHGRLIKYILKTPIKRDWNYK